MGHQDHNNLKLICLYWKSVSESHLGSGGSSRLPVLHVMDTYCFVKVLVFTWMLRIQISCRSRCNLLSKTLSGWGWCRNLFCSLVTNLPITPPSAGPALLDTEIPRYTAPLQQARRWNFNGKRLRRDFIARVCARSSPMSRCKLGWYISQNKASIMFIKSPEKARDVWEQPVSPCGHHQHQQMSPMFIDTLLCRL